MPIGRPTKLTPERSQRLLDAIATGASYEACCSHAGVSYAGFRRWMQRGERARSGAFRDFFDAVTRAKSSAEILAAGVLQGNFQGRDAVKAATFFLERRNPEQWGRQTRVDANVTGSVTVTLADFLGKGSPKPAAPPEEKP